MALRLVIFDRTCTSAEARGLSHVWSSGTKLYRLLGRIDKSFGAASFEEAFGFLRSFRPTEQISELQFWGHGKWGRILIARESLDRTALNPRHRHHSELQALRERLSPGALCWFRSCETFGARAGHDFAQAWTDFFGCRAAAHTYVIGLFQSGLHLLEPGHKPHWSVAEGLAAGSPDAPSLALASAPDQPNTITCFTGEVPAGW